MDIVLPSLSAILLALAIIMYVYPRLAPIILAVFAAVALIYGIHSHFMMFGAEYSSMTWVNRAKLSAPYIMTGTILVFIVGFLLYLYGGKRPATSSYTNTAANTNSNNTGKNNTGNSYNSGNNNSKRNEFSRRV